MNIQVAQGWRQRVGWTGLQPPTVVHSIEKKREGGGRIEGKWRVRKKKGAGGRGKGMSPPTRSS
jgi:hypothetical protein